MLLGRMESFKTILNEVFRSDFKKETHAFAFKYEWEIALVNTHLSLLTQVRRISNLI
jgi:hypothetical protein